MRPEKKPHANLLIVTPVWGAYDIVKKCIEAVEENTVTSFYHVLVNDNYHMSLKEAGILPNERRACIDVYNDPVGYQHVEQIGKMMDLGLQFGKHFTSFKHLVKLETDNIVQLQWDTILLREAAKLDKWAVLEAYSVDVDEKMTDEQIQERVDTQTRDGGTYGKDWVEQNLCLFSPEIMHFNWCFSMVPHAVDQHLSKHMQTLSGNLFNYETKETHVLHYRSSSRRHYS